MKKVELIKRLILLCLVVTLAWGAIETGLAAKCVAAMEGIVPNPWADYQEGYQKGYFEGELAGHQRGYLEGYQEGIKTTGYSLHNPSYKALKAFLAEDRTNSRQWEPGYTCLDFALALNENAEKVGIRTGIVYLDFVGQIDHMINVFETIDRGLVFIEPQSDGERVLAENKNYCQLNSERFLGIEDCTLMRYVIVW